MPEDKDTDALLKTLTERGTYFGATAEHFIGDPPIHTIAEVLEIPNEELNTYGRALAKQPSLGESTAELFGRVSDGIQAYLQFQDLMEINFDSDDQIHSGMEYFFNRGYFYYESLAYLRSAVVSTLNANCLSSLALLRPFIELFVFFLYYRYMTKEKGLDQLYDWVNRGKGKPSFRHALDYVARAQGDSTASLSVFVHDLYRSLQLHYKALSSYNHTPRLEESVGTKSLGFGPSHLEFIYYTLYSVQHLLELIVPMMTIARPMIMFPLDKLERFGFSGPVGMFSDECNHRIVKKFIGEELSRNLQRTLKADADVDALHRFFFSRKVLTETEIRKTYDPDSSESQSIPENEPLHALIARKKAKLRLIGWAFNYYRPIASQKTGNT
jgi:hypothetical protein